MHNILAHRWPNKNVVEDTINKLSIKFGDNTELSTSWWKVIKYKGMKSDYMTKGTVKISINEFINKMLAELASDMNGIAKTSAAVQLLM